MVNDKQTSSIPRFFYYIQIKNTINLPDTLGYDNIMINIRISEITAIQWYTQE